MSKPSHKTHRFEWIVIGLLLLACVVAGFWLYRPRTGLGDTVAVISVDGAEVYRVNLTEARAPFAFRIEEETGKPVEFEVSENRIRFVNVTCPDHVCEKTGWCANPGDRAVCLPNKTTLICYDGGELEPGSPAEWITATNAE